MKGPSGSWFFVPRRLANPRVRVFCFPYAGGSATLFRDWPKELPGDVELIGVQLPGRAFRLKDPPFTQMSSLLDELENQLGPHLDVPFVFWGHSFGAILAYELIRRFEKQGRTLPLMAILSGRKAPHLPNTGFDVRGMGDDEFIEELRKLGGTPDEIINNRRLMNLVLPALRADFELLNTWQHESGQTLAVPLRIVGGKEDLPIKLEDLEAWGQYTRSGFSVHLFKGDHFYVHHAEDELLPWLSTTLANLSA
jgi:medium-chain acyl-[acyl-carrier-protein] hydrolase